MNANLEHYKVFYFVAKNNSVTLAANELFISQPAVSQAIKQLEHTLGCSLFFRAPKGVNLTKEGEMLYSYIKQGYEFFELGEKKLEEMLNFETGEIRIGASDMTLKYYLLPYLEKFHRSYPSIKIIVSNAPTPETIDSLKTGKIDFGIVSSPVDESKDYNVYDVAEISDIFVASSRFGWLNGKTVGLSELERLPTICLEKNTSTRKFVDSFLAENSVTLKPEFELATSDLIVKFAEMDIGIGCVVKNFAQEGLDKGSLFELSLSKPIPPRKICLVTGNKSRISQAGKKLLDTMI